MDNRKAYGLAKEHGIDTKGMTPKEVWDALNQKGVIKEKYSSDGNGGSHNPSKAEIERMKELGISDTQEKESSDADDTRIIKIDMDSEVQKQFDRATPKERQKIAFDYIMKNLRGKYPAEDGRIVSIEKVGAKKITHDRGNIKIRVVPKLGKLIQTGSFIESKEAEHKIFKGFAYYKVRFQFGKDIYSAILNVGIRENGDSTLYEINQFNKNK